MRIVARIGLAFSFAVGLGVELASGSPAGLRLTHYPEAAYLNERVTFVLAAEPGDDVAAEIDGRLVTNVTARGESVEFNLRLRGPGLLAFRAKTGRLDFRLVIPDETCRMSELNGSLRCDGVPVILVARHRFPPKHDRRWETVSFLARLARDTRPTVRSACLMAGASLFPAVSAERLDGLTAVRTGFWRRPRAAIAFREINGFIAGAPALPHADLLVIAPSAGDQEFGIDPLEYAIKLEWLLQAVEKFRYPHVILFPPLFSARERIQSGHILPRCRLAALGNRAAYASVHESDAPAVNTEEGWANVVAREIRRRLRCE